MKWYDISCDIKSRQIPYPTRRCCEGDNRVAPHQETRNKYKCPERKGLIHTLCGEFDFNTNALYCKTWFPRASANKVSVTSNIIPVTELSIIVVDITNELVEVFTTKTNNNESQSVRFISKYSFLLKNQRLNPKMKEKYEHWIELQINKMNIVYSELKYKITIEAQRVNLNIMRIGKSQVVNEL